MDAELRNPRNDDTAALRHIWRTVFSVDDEDLFFSHYYDPALCIEAISADKPVASGYLLPCGNLVSGGKAAPCAMIYGVATLPGYRSLGYGAAVVHGLIGLGNKLGYAAIALCPSEDSLFGYYSARSNLRDWFYVLQQETVINPPSQHKLPLSPVAPDEYIRLREPLLDGIAHISLDERAAEYQALICSRFGGGLYRIDSGIGVSCAVIEKQTGGEVRVKELLLPPGPDDADIRADILSAISAAFPADKYIIRSPVRSRAAASGRDLQADTAALSTIKRYQSDCKIRRFGMLAPPDIFPDDIFPADIVGDAALPWLGLAFD